MTQVAALEDAVWAALRAVPDPEIPAVSVVDMGMIADVTVAGGQADIVVLPTFSGCPAIGVILADVKKAVRTIDGIEGVTATTTFSPPWTTERITEDGRRKLEEFGIAPPTGTGPVLITSIGLPLVSKCPFCGSTDTRNDNLFGPTPCRALYYCESCKNPFEQFKPI